MISLILLLPLLCTQIYPIPLKNLLSPHYLSQTLDLTYHFLIITCFPLFSASYTATPTSLHAWANSSLSFHYKVHGGLPFQLMHLDEIYNFKITEMTKGTLTGRAVQLLQSYLNNITEHYSNKVPILRPITTNTIIVSQAPLCINRTHPAGKVLGYLDQRLCHFTLEIQPSFKHWASYVVTQTAYFSKPVQFSAWPTISATFPTTDTSQFCSGRPLSCVNYFPWQDCKSQSRSNCRQIPSHGLTHSKFWVDTDRKYIFFENTTTGATQVNPGGPFQLLTGATLAGTLSVWENENNKLTHLFTIEKNFCLKNQGILLLCGTNTYLCLPANWTGTCTLVYHP